MEHTLVFNTDIKYGSDYTSPYASLYISYYPSPFDLFHFKIPIKKVSLTRFEGKISFHLMKKIFYMDVSLIGKSGYSNIIFHEEQKYFSTTSLYYNLDDLICPFCDYLQHQFPSHCYIKKCNIIF